MNSPDPADKSQSRKARATAAAADLAAGKSEQSVIEKMAASGLSSEEAAQMVASLRPVVRKVQRMKNRNLLIGGIVWTAASIFATAAAYYTSASHQVPYVCWGIVAFGLFDVVVGLVGWLRYREPASGPAAPGE